MPTKTDARNQVVAGVVPPKQAEAVIRVVWPSVAAFPAVATVGRKLTLLIVTAPLAWLMLAPFYFVKILPFLARRYALTNRRVMIQRGLKPRSTHEVPLSAIDDIQIKTDGNTPFFRAANLEILSKGQVVLTLKGVPGPEGFRHAILSAAKAWAPFE